MRQAWRMIAGLLAIGVVAAGGSVALADSGGHGGRDNNGNRGNALATTVFTMPAAPDGNPEGIAVDRRSGRFFVSSTATGAIFAGTSGRRRCSRSRGVRPNPAPTDPPVATGLKTTAAPPTSTAATAC